MLLAKLAVQNSCPVVAQAELVPWNQRMAYRNWVAENYHALLVWAPTDHLVHLAKDPRPARLAAVEKSNNITLAVVKLKVLRILGANSGLLMYR